MTERFADDSRSEIQHSFWGPARLRWVKVGFEEEEQQASVEIVTTMFRTNLR